MNITGKLVPLVFIVNPCQGSCGHGAWLCYSTTASFLLEICYGFEALHLKTDAGWGVWITSGEK